MNKRQLRQKVVRETSDQDFMPNSEIGSLTQFQLSWRRFKKSRLGLYGAVIIVLLYLSAIFAGFLAPYHYNTQSIHHVHVPPQLPRIYDEEGLHWPFIYNYKLTRSDNSLERIYVPDKSKRYPIRFFHKGDEYKLLGLFKTNVHLFGVQQTQLFLLGTDRMGRDLLSRILYGARVSLTIGLVGVLITTVLGTTIGTVSGYYGGWIDTLIQRLIELLMSFPAIPLWMALAAALPPHWSSIKVYFGIVTILSLIGWGALARQIRGLVLSYREADSVKAARSFGASDSHVIFRHLIPSCYSYLIVIATLAIPATILGETALSFLGLGIRPPMTSWGVLLEEAQHMRVIVQFPWLLIPTVPVLLTVVSFNFLGDALRTAVNPSSK